MVETRRISQSEDLEVKTANYHYSQCISLRELLGENASPSQSSSQQSSEFAASPSKPPSHNFVVTKEGGPPHQARPMYVVGSSPRYSPARLLRRWLAHREPPLQSSRDQHWKTQRGGKPILKPPHTSAATLSCTKQFGGQFENVKPFSLPSQFLRFHHELLNQQLQFLPPASNPPGGECSPATSSNPPGGRALSITLLNAPAA